MPFAKQINTNRRTSLEHVKPTQLIAHSDNPRLHSKKQIRQIAKSIETFGFRFPVLVDSDYRLICGHGRVEAAKLLDMDSIPALIANDLDENQVRALMIADNKLTENSSWDNDLLGQNLMILEESELNFDLEITGFDYGHIQQLVLAVDEDDISDESTLPSIPNHHVTQPGDLWQLGDHRLLCADALNPDSYNQLLDNHCVDIVLTDPPYNLAAKTIGKVAETQHGDFAQAAGEMTSAEFTDFLNTLIQQLVEHSKNGSIHYLFMDWRHAHELLTAAQTHYTDFKNLCVWTKDVAGMGSFYRSQHELVFVFKNGTEPHTNNFELGQYNRNRSNVWPYRSARHLNADDGNPDGQSALQVHPTIKPVQLLEDALLDCSKKHEIVLDPFLGSGSTLIACEKTTRQCRAIELSPQYVDVAIERWQQWTQQDATHASSGQSFNHRKKGVCHD